MLVMAHISWGQDATFFLLLLLLKLLFEAGAEAHWANLPPVAPAPGL